MAMLGEAVYTTYTGDTRTRSNGRKAPMTLADRTPGTATLTLEPMTSGELKRIEEIRGQHFGGGYTVFCESQLSMSPALWFSDGTYIYELISQQTWPDDDLEYYEYEAVLLNPQPAAS